MTFLAVALAVFASLLGALAFHKATREPSAPPGYDTLQKHVTDVREAVRALAEEPPQSRDPRIGPLQETLEAVMDAFADLESEVQEKFDANYRREQRIRETLRVAEEKYQESGELTPAAIAEIRQARQRYGEGGQDEGVPPVHEGVGGGQESSVPGVTVEQLRQARMM